MKNVNTPRTLAECQFHVGYPSKQPPKPNRIADVVVAVVLGVIGAALALHWWAA